MCVLKNGNCHQQFCDMHEIAIIRGDQRFAYSLADDWSEIERQDWAAIAIPFLQGDTPRTRTAALRRLLKRKGKVISPILFNKLNGDQLKQISVCIDWIWEKRLTTQPFAAVKVQDGQELLLPGDGLKSVTLIEYAFLDLYYNVYMQMIEAGNEEQAESYLHHLLCYMLRPQKEGLDIDKPDPDTWDGDPREKFNTDICERRIPLIKKLKPEVKLALLMFFVGCKAKIHEDFEGTVFINSVDKDGNTVHTGGRPMEPTEWLDMCFALSGGIFGTLEQTMYAPLFTVLRHLQLQELKPVKK